MSEAWEEFYKEANAVGFSTQLPSVKDRADFRSKSAERGITSFRAVYITGISGKKGGAFFGDEKIYEGARSKAMQIALKIAQKRGVAFNSAHHQGRGLLQKLDDTYGMTHSSHFTPFTADPYDEDRLVVFFWKKQNKR